MPKPLEHPTHRVVYALKGCCSTPGSPRRAQHPTLYSHNAVFDEYLKISGKPIERSIRAELSGDFEKLMLAVGTVVRLGGKTITGIAGAAWCSTSTSGVRGGGCAGQAAIVPLPITLSISPAVKCVRSTAEYFAERLYKAMKVGASPQPKEISPHCVSEWL